MAKAIRYQINIALKANSELRRLVAATANKAWNKDRLVSHCTCAIADSAKLHQVVETGEGDQLEEGISSAQEEG
jgi:hypothetical protein